MTIGTTQTIDMGDGKLVTLETGKLAKQAHGSVVVSQGKTKILASVVSGYKAREGVDFLPLSVDYQEKFASVGRIPGSFHRREARLSEYEILICRIVDRSLRPLFPGDYHAETQVMISLISSDEDVKPDSLVVLAASTAISLTDIPFDGPISAVRMGRVNGEYIVNPSITQMEESDMDIIVAGTAKDINMVEGEMKEISEADMIEALKIGHEAVKKQIAAQHELVEKVGGKKEVREYNHEENDEELKEKVIKETYDDIYALAQKPTNKKDRSAAFDELLESYLSTYPEDTDDSTLSLVKKYFGSAKKKAIRAMILETKSRLDGRAMDEVRDIWTEIDYLPAAHGSAVFTRGETQVLSTVTLGSKLDQQLLDTPMHNGYSAFMLHYNFPAFSVGEARPNRGPGRREIGHGNLALRGLKNMLPEDIGYTVRIVADVLESNGSSSMATVCSGSMALMDAGIKVKKPVSGIAMGMISDAETGNYAILSDILGDEDHLGDMDFKVVGTEDGILACQMDIKVDGLSYDVLAEALEQARKGRLHILGEMSKTISEGREELKDHTPRIVKFQVEKDKIGAIIGSGGKVIQELQAETNTTISIEEVDGYGIVEIMSADKEGLEAAKTRIDGICEDPEVGKEYVGKVESILEFGALIEILPGNVGLLHISEISWNRLESMEGVLEEGEEVRVKLIDIDERSGKYKLSRKVLLPKPEGYVEPAPRERRGGGRNDRRNGGRNDRRGNDRGPRNSGRRDNKPRRKDNNRDRSQDKPVTGDVG